MNKPIVAYRKGSLDAFIAAFIYWKHFAHTLGQGYYAVDPLSDNPLSLLDNTPAPFLISIGTNLKDCPAHIKLFSIEVDKTFTPQENFLNLQFWHMPEKSLTHALIDIFIEQGDFDVTSPTFKLLNQFLRLNEDHQSVVHPEIADEIATVFPKLEPKDFLALDKMLTSPDSPLLILGNKKLVKHAIDDNDRRMEAAIDNRSVITTVGGEQLVLINSPEYNHPLVERKLLNETLPVLVYQQVRDSIRGKLITPKPDAPMVDVFSTMGKLSGTDRVHDVRIPYSIFGSVLSYSSCMRQSVDFNAA